MATRKQVEQGLDDIGACWAIRSGKFCGANDPFDYQINGRKTYHIYPDASYPHQSTIKLFDTLDEIWSWIQACKRAATINERNPNACARVVWTGYDYDVIEE